MIGGIDQLTSKFISSMKGKEAVAATVAAAGSLASASHLGEMRKEIAAQRALLQQIGVGISSQISSIKELNDTVKSQSNSLKDLSDSWKDGLKIFDDIKKGVGSLSEKISSGGGGGGVSDKSSVEIQKLAMKMTSQSNAQVNATKGIGNNIKELSSGITSVMTKLEEEARRREEEREADAEKKKPGFFKNASTQIKSGAQSTKDSLGILAFIIPAVAALANVIKEKFDAIKKGFAESVDYAAKKYDDFVKATDFLEPFRNMTTNLIELVDVNFIQPLRQVDLKFFFNSLEEDFAKLSNKVFEIIVGALPDSVGKMIFGDDWEFFSKEVKDTQEKMNTKEVEKEKRELESEIASKGLAKTNQDFYDKMENGNYFKKMAGTESSGGRGEGDGSGLVGTHEGSTARGLFGMNKKAFEEVKNTATENVNEKDPFGYNLKSVLGTKQIELLSKAEHNDIVRDPELALSAAKAYDQIARSRLAKSFGKDVKDVSDAEARLAYQLGPSGAAWALSKKEMVIPTSGSILNDAGKSMLSERAIKDHGWGGKKYSEVIEEIQEGYSKNNNTLLAGTASGSIQRPHQLYPSIKPTDKTNALSQPLGGSFLGGILFNAPEAKNPPAAQPMVLAPQQVTNAPVSSNSSVVNYFGETESAISKWCNIINASHSYG